VEMLFSRLHRSLTIARRACVVPERDPSLGRRRATQRYPRSSDATAPVKGPYVACALPAQTSKFIADSKNDIANVPRPDNEFLGFVSNILSYGKVWVSVCLSVAALAEGKPNGPAQRIYGRTARISEGG
jgi:hypothetical protein